MWSVFVTVLLTLCGVLAVLNFAMQMTETYEQDLKAAKRYSLDQWQHRSWAQKLAELVLLPIRSQL